MSSAAGVPAGFGGGCFCATVLGAAAPAGLAAATAGQWRQRASPQLSGARLRRGSCRFRCSRRHCLRSWLRVGFLGHRVTKLRWRLWRCSGW